MVLIISLTGNCRLAREARKQLLNFNCSLAVKCKKQGNGAMGFERLWSSGKDSFMRCDCRLCACPQRLLGTWVPKLYCHPINQNKAHTPSFSTENNQIFIRLILLYCWRSERRQCSRLHCVITIQLQVRLAQKPPHVAHVNSIVMQSYFLHKRPTQVGSLLCFFTLTFRNHHVLNSRQQHKLSICGRPSYDVFFSTLPCFLKIHL